MIKILSRLILLFLALTITTNSTFANEDIVVEYEGFCPNYPVTFTIFNRTQYQDKKNIEDDLCTVNETPSEDNCEQWETFDMEVTIYNGPIDGLPVLQEYSLKDKREFQYTFPTHNDFLIEFELTGNTLTKYNKSKKFEERMTINECKFSSKNKNNNNNEQNEQSNQKINQTFLYQDNKIEINLENTNIQKSEDINISFINPRNENIQMLENEIQSIKIELPNQEFTKFEANFFIEESNEKLKIFQYKNNNWEEFNSNPKIENQRIYFEIVESGIYGIQIEKEQEIEIDVETTTENNNQNEQNQNTQTNTNNQQNTNQQQETTTVQLDLEDATKKIDPKILIGIIILIIAIVAFLAMPSKKSSDWNYHDHRNPINNETYTKTKQYVQKYKQTYNKEQIKQSLTNAKIDNQVIEKVLKEEFPENQQ